MANFNEAVLTKKGISLLAKAQAGQAGIKFTRAVTGSGSYEEGESLVEKEALKDQRQEFPFDKISVENSTTVSVKFTITNEQETGNLQEGYHVKEIGISAEDPDEGEILYAIATAVEGQWDYMPAYNSLLPAYITVEFYAEVSNAASVTIVTAGRFVTAEEMEAELEKIRDDARTEHDAIRKEAEAAHTSLRELIMESGQVPEGVLTEADKGVKNGVASLDSGGRIPAGQLPYDSGAVYLGEKLAFKDFTWRAIEGHTGWVGTFVSAYGPGSFSDLTGGLWSEMQLAMDPGRLYAMYTESYADHLASVYCSLDFRAFLKVIDGKRTIKVFADSNLGESEAAEVAFWPYVLRRGIPDY